jgi:chromosomal replication initiator protein
MDLIRKLKNNELITQEDIGSFEKINQITFKKVEIAVLKATGLTYEVLRKRCRKREIVMARQLICCFSKMHSLGSLTQIGQFIGGYDHATVSHSINVIDDMKNSDALIKNFYNKIIEIL